MVQEIAQVRTIQVMNIKNEPIQLTIVGAIIRHVEPVRQTPQLPSRREWERRERACVDCPPIA